MRHPHVHLLVLIRMVPVNCNILVMLRLAETGVSCARAVCPEWHLRMLIRSLPLTAQGPAVKPLQAMHAMQRDYRQRCDRVNLHLDAAGPPRWDAMRRRPPTEEPQLASAQRIGGSTGSSKHGKSWESHSGWRLSRKTP